MTVDNPLEPSDDPGALVEYPYPCLCCDELTAAKAEIARLADALKQAHSRAESLHDRLGASLWDCDAARTENAALRYALEILGEWANQRGHTETCLDINGWLNRHERGLVKGDERFCRCGLAAALAPPEPRRG